MRIRRNPDEALRRLERAASGGDPRAEVDLLRARVRTGSLRELDVLFLAYLGWLPAMRYREGMTRGEFEQTLYVNQFRREQLTREQVLVRPPGTLYLGVGPGYVLPDNYGRRDTNLELAWLPEGHGLASQTLRSWLHDMYVYSTQAWVRAGLEVFVDLIDIEQNGLENHTGLHVCAAQKAVAKLLYGRGPHQATARPRNTRTYARWVGEMGRASWVGEMRRASDYLFEYYEPGQEAEWQVTDAAANLLELAALPPWDPSWVSWVPEGVREEKWSSLDGIVDSVEDLRGDDRWTAEIVLRTVQESLVPWVLHGSEETVFGLASPGGPAPDSWCRWDRTIEEIEEEEDW